MWFIRNMLDSSRSCKHAAPRVLISSTKGKSLGTRLVSCVLDLHSTTKVESRLHATGKRCVM